MYITIDIDVLDPAFAPGTGTPEPAGLSSRELFRSVRPLPGPHARVTCHDGERDSACTAALACTGVFRSHLREGI